MSGRVRRAFRPARPLATIASICATLVAAQLTLPTAAAAEERVPTISLAEIPAGLALPDNALPCVVDLPVDASATEAEIAAVIPAVIPAVLPAADEVVEGALAAVLTDTARGRQNSGRQTFGRRAAERLPRCGGPAWTEPIRVLAAEALRDAITAAPPPVDVPVALVGGTPPPHAAAARPPVQPPVEAAIVTAPAPLVPRAAQPTGALTLTKVASAARANYGSTLTYTLFAGATGVRQNRVTVTDLIPTGASFVAGSAACAGVCSVGYTPSTRTVRWSLGALPAGSRVGLSFRVTVPRPATRADGTAAGTTLRNSGVIRSDQSGPVRSNVVRTVVAAITGGSGRSGAAPLTPVTVPTPPPPAAATPAPVIAPPNGTAVQPDGTLANTGTSTAPVVLLALMLLVMGTGLISVAGRLTAGRARGSPARRQAATSGRPSGEVPRRRRRRPELAPIPIRS